LSPLGILSLLVVTALAGGVLASAHLAMRRLPRPRLPRPRLPHPRLPHPRLPHPRPSRPRLAFSLHRNGCGWQLRRICVVERWRIMRHAPLPYALAIACGGVWAVLNNVITGG
jgi:prepilin peptidase CpaA